MAFNFVKDNKCFGRVIRGTHTIESISAGETKVVTIQLSEEIRSDMICVVNSWEWPLHAEVQAIGNSVNHEGYAILTVINEGSTSIANAKLNYAFI